MDATDEAAAHPDEGVDPSAPITRRVFLKASGALVIATGIAVATTGCAESNAPAVPPAPAADEEYLEVPMTPMQPLPTGMFQFFTPHEGATIEAFTARIFPGTPGDPGAREAGVVHYIDNMLTFHNGDASATYRNGPFAHAYEGDEPPPGLDLTKVVPVKKSELPRYSYQSSQTPDIEYRLGILAVDQYARTKFGKDFVDLTEGQQDSIIGDMAENRATGFTTPAAQDFFVTLRTGTIQGMFSDPLYGGNRDMVGWKLVGYPGAQRGWTPTEMQTEGTRRPYQSIAMLHPEAHGKPADGALLPVSGSRQG